MADAETIVVLTTGGTIDKTYFDALSSYQVGESVVARVLGEQGSRGCSGERRDPGS